MGEETDVAGEVVVVGRVMFDRIEMSVVSIVRVGGGTVGVYGAGGERRWSMTVNSEAREDETQAVGKIYARGKLAELCGCLSRSE